MPVVIYKITSPTQKVYVGQSVDVAVRWADYRRHKAPKQAKLNASFRKHGVSAHGFEVLCELPEGTHQVIVDRHEQLFMDLYREAGYELLNLRHAGSKGRHSAESLAKLSRSKMGQGKGRAPWNKGLRGIYSEETITKIKAARARQPKTQYSPEIIERMSAAATKRGISDLNRAGLNAGRRRDYLAGKFSWPGTKLTPDQVREIRQRYIPNQLGSAKLAREYGVSKGTIKAILSGRNWRHI